MTCCSTENASPCCKKKKCCIKIAAIILALIAIGAGAYCWVNKADAQNALASLSGDSKGPSLKKAVKDDVVYATVNGEKITGKDLNALIKSMPAQVQDAPAATVLPMLVNQVANDRMVDTVAAKQNLAGEKIVQERVANATRQIVRERYVEKYMDGKVTDSALKKKYDELMAANPPQEEVQARHILVKDEAKAVELIAQLNKGGDFAKLAKENSIDPSKDNGGELGYFTKNMMVKEFGDAAFAMKEGDFSKTPVKTQFGYHIILVEDKRMQQKPAFNDVKEQVRTQLTQDLVRQMIDTMRKENNVQITLPEEKK